ncbi:permease [Corallococcus sp. H22C18031201]|uniref:alpha/beta fold hydrolase n=1 Tax=Citreicoccus inhibens TaxID=2849499 RepID=UPI000E737DE5|nr:alpha/beta fold hydrolase [Citreicoccus inhibens]MBU8899252.1 alpha/beta hydrolase [Citreicoccus inhibens]RJS25737.1 permease [Corallococcus sp. H22C18031201]
MNLFVLQYRKLMRRWRHLTGYLHLTPRARPVPRRTDFQDCARPVLLLHGFLSTHRVLEVLEHRLRRDGYCVWTLHLGGMLDRLNIQGVDELAHRVRGKVERLYTRHPDMGPLTIIGHSKGGLIGHYYVKRLGGDTRVRSLVTLGTPHRGSKLAYLGCMTLGWASRAMWQLTPVSPFIKHLSVGAFPRDVRLVSIYSRADAVAPWPSAVLHVDGQPNVFNLEVPGVSHGELLTKRSVYEVIRRELALGYGVSEPAVEPTLVSLPSAGS